MTENEIYALEQRIYHAPLSAEKLTSSTGRESSDLAAAADQSDDHEITLAPSNNSSVSDAPTASPQVSVGTENTPWRQKVNAEIHLANVKHASVHGSLFQRMRIGFTNAIGRAEQEVHNRFAAWRNSGKTRTADTNMTGVLNSHVIDLPNESIAEVPSSYDEELWLNRMFGQKIVDQYRQKPNDYQLEKFCRARVALGREELQKMGYTPNQIDNELDRRAVVLANRFKSAIAGSAL